MVSNVAVVQVGCNVPVGCKKDYKNQAGGPMGWVDLGMLCETFILSFNQFETKRQY